MRKISPVLVVTLGLLSLNATAEPISDAKSAIAAAKVALQPEYGSTFNQGRPRPYVGDGRRFYATLRGNTWLVEDAPPNRRQWVNPILRVQLDATSSAVRSIVDTGK